MTRSKPLFAAAIVTIAWSFTTGDVVAQDEAKTALKGAPQKAAKTAKSATKPQREDIADDKAFMDKVNASSKAIDFDTDDGVYLSLRYWSPKKAGKETPCILLVHSKDGSQRDWYRLAQFISEKYEFAVLTFDFRGHGDSKEYNPEIYRNQTERAEKRRPRPADRIVPQGSRKFEEAAKAGDPKRKKNQRNPKIDLKMEYRKGADFVRRFPLDIEAARKFLVERHNSGELNIRQLGIVCSGSSANIVLGWFNEFEFSEKGNIGGWTPQGGDVSALVMVSPTWNLIGATPPKFGDRLDDLPILLYSANSPEQIEDAQKYSTTLNLPFLKREGDAAPKGLKQPPKNRKESGWIHIGGSSLSGTDLLNPAVNSLDQEIGDFMKNRLAPKKSRGWEKRDIDIDKGGFGSAR
jgi:hypothetical protein